MEIFSYFSDTITRKLRCEPSDTISFVRQNASMTCCTSYTGSSVWWQHRRVKGIGYNNVYLSFIGFQDEYAAGGRHSIISNRSTGQFNLHIENVRLDDAGIYDCIDRDGLGYRASAELVVVGQYNCYLQHAFSFMVQCELSCEVSILIASISCPISLRYYSPSILFMSRKSIGLLI